MGSFFLLIFLVLDW